MSPLLGSGCPVTCLQHWVVAVTLCYMSDEATNNPLCLVGWNTWTTKWEKSPIVGLPNAEATTDAVESSRQALQLLSVFHRASEPSPADYSPRQYLTTVTVQNQSQKHPAEPCQIVCFLLILTKDFFFFHWHFRESEREEEINIERNMMWERDSKWLPPTLIWDLGSSVQRGTCPSPKPNPRPFSLQAML